MKKIKTIFLLFITNVVIVATLNIFAYIIGKFFNIDLYYQGTLFYLSIFALIFGFLGAYINLLLSKRLVKNIYHVRFINNNSNGKEKFIYDTVVDLAKKNHIKTPEVGVYTSKEINAFATGPNKNNSIIALSNELINQMTEDEIKGVIGHEFSHILNGDMVRMTILQGLMNTFIIFLSRIITYAIDIIVKKDNDRGLGKTTYVLIVYFLDILLGFIAMIILMKFSRQREFNADYQSAMMIGKNNMINALKKLQLLNNSKKLNQINQQDEFSYLKITSGKKWLNILKSHPSLEERIKRLQKIK